MKQPGTKLTPLHQRMVDTFEEHLRAEFETMNVESALETMVEEPYVNHVPVLTGGVGKELLRRFYSDHFVGRMPPDLEMIPVSQTVGDDRLVAEMVIRFTHTVEMAWMLPGVPPTGKRVEFAIVVIVQFRDGKMVHEHIYWDQASVLVQLGLIDPSGLPVAEVDSARKVLDPKLPSNQLLERAGQNR